MTDDGSQCPESARSNATSSTTGDAPACPECGHEPLEPNKTVEGNEVTTDGWYCPDCGAEYQEDATLQWDEIDFPVWVHEECRLDDWQFLRTFEYGENFYRGDYNGAPNLRDMKCIVFTVWFKVTEDGSVEGPYDAKRGEKI